MGSFDGVADVYEQARHGYPTELRAHLVKVGALSPDCRVVDLGAGTGQLSMLVADVAASIVAIDPEPDMVRRGQQVTSDRLDIRWMLGSDRDVCDLLESPVDLVLIGNAFHHMDQVGLLADLDSLVSPSGNVVVCSSSTPVWLQEADWSVALREQLGAELGRSVGSGGTPDHESDLAVLGASPFSNVERWVLERERPRSAESIVGEVVSSASGAIDEQAARRLHAALEPYLPAGAVAENVVTTALIGTRARTDR